MPQIQITVNRLGEPTVQTVGFSGTGCQTASQFVERALGQRMHEQLTPEYHQTETRNAARELETG